MKTCKRHLALLFMAMFAYAGFAFGADEMSRRVQVSDLSVLGAIDGENITFTMDLTIDVDGRNVEMPLVVGDVAFLDGTFPRGAELVRDGTRYVLKFRSGGKHTISMNFASRAAKDKEWRQTGFTIPASTIRKLSVVCDRDDLEVQFPGALKVQRGLNADEQTEVTAFLGVSQRFEVRWKPEVLRLDAELVVAAEANTIATASVGAMRLDTVFTYRVVQGSLSALAFDLPRSVNVTQVKGDDIQDWRIEEEDDGARVLLVTLSHPREDGYKLQVESETILPEFPTTVDLPVVTPRDVIRTSGFLKVGTDSVIRLLVRKSLGLTQVDQSAFPLVALDADPKVARKSPTRNTFVYQYANSPYTLQLDADDIVPEYTVRDDLVLSLHDNDLVLIANLNVDVRAAETRELVVQTSPDWIVANVAGKKVTDYDVRDIAGVRNVHIFFKDGILGTELVELRLEKALSDDARSFAAPNFALKGAKSERGDLVLAAEKGFRLTASSVEGVREIRTGATALTVSGAQQAFRFKEAGWKIAVDIDRTTASIHSEIFHLVSIGEGVLYGGSTMTYHISGAPTRIFRVTVPAAYQNVEFMGRDVRNFQKAEEGDVWTVYLQEKVIGDYNLLVTYDLQCNPDEDVVDVGGVATVDMESEVGYIALASSASLLIEDVELDPKALLVIDAEEIPDEYELLINDPVLRAYKYVRSPHVARVRIKRFATEALLNQVVDHASLETHISPDGETVTTVTYFIKNASQQYLVVALPENAHLWYAKVSGDDGTLVSVRPPQSDKGVLVPLRRLPDPNTPIKVQLQYAESHGKPSAMGTALDLRAPRTHETHATATRWVVHAPQGQLISGVAGNMLSDFVAAPAGLGRVASRVIVLARHVLLSLAGAQLALGLAGLGACICGLAFFRSRVAGLWVAVPVIVLLGLAACAVMLVAVGRFAIQGPLVGGSLVSASLGDAQVIFTKMVSLASGDDLLASVRVVPPWLGLGGSLWQIAVAGLGGVVAVGAGLRLHRTIWIALGGALLLAAAAQTSIGRSLVYWLTLLAGAACLLACLLCAMRASRTAGVRSGAQHAQRAAQRREASVTLASPPAIGASATADDDDELFESPEEPESDPRDGSACLGLLFAMLACVLLVTVSVRAEEVAQIVPAPVSAPVVVVPKRVAPVPDVPYVPVMEFVKLNVRAPEMGRDEERSAEVQVTISFEADDACQFRVLDDGAVLTHSRLSSRSLSLVSSLEGYVLKVAKKGSYTVSLTSQITVSESNGRWGVEFGLLPNMRNEVILRLPEADLDVQCPLAVLFRTSTLENRTHARALFGPVDKIGFTWQPRVRKTRLEKAVYICEVNTLASFEPGVVDLLNLVRFQIAQGEIKAMQMHVPEGMSVTSVRADGLSTWRFDPEKRLLDAVLESPVTGDFEIQVMSQVATEGLPYQVTLGALEVEGAVRQRGAIAMASPDTVQARIGDMQGLTAMNTADFSGRAITLMQKQSGRNAMTSIKRAFRHHENPVSAIVSAERVLPEVRVHEADTLSVRTERIWMSSQLEIEVSKAGIFSLRLRIPDGYDVETLTGEDVSHWDEVKDEEANLVVHFTKQVIGKRRLNVEIASTGGDTSLDRIVVPRIAVLDAHKLNGHIKISGEHGIRLTPVDAEREGVSDLNPRVDLGLNQPGMLAFKLLRPTWQIVLHADVQQATVKPRVLQHVQVAEGMVQGHCYVLYDIQNAGTKTFLLRSPRPDIPIAVTGADIAKVSKVDEAEGIWQVDLHNKKLENYLLEVTYQIPFDPNAKRAVITPLRTLGADPQSGYVVVMSQGRIQVQSDDTAPAGLKPEDSRSIPGEFHAGDLSDAILCYRAVSGNYALPLSVVRHKTAEVLPAHVHRVDLTSVLSDGGQLLTRVDLRATVGSLRFLTVTLPEPSDRIWTVFVNGNVSRPSRAEDGVSFRVPLDDTSPEAETLVELTYASTRVRKKWSFRSQNYRAPKFGLPLHEITWTLHVPPGMKYYDFEGDIEVVEAPSREGAPQGLFDEALYMEYNRRAAQQNRARAISDMEAAETFANEGNQRLAKKKLEEAMNLAPSQQDYEDASIQYRNLVKQQAVVGLVQRRNKMRSDMNIQGDEQGWQMRGFREGNYTAKYAEQVSQSLSAKDNTALLELADRFIEQQAAAAGVAESIKIDMPPSGRVLTFHRPVQIDWGSDLNIAFKTRATHASQWWEQVWPTLVLFMGLSLVLRRRS